MFGHFGEYEKGLIRINPAKAWWDTEILKKATVLTVDSANKHGSLLEIVQLLVDLDLNILKATISSDGCWLLDVFHITHQSGQKVDDTKILEYMNLVLTGKVEELKEEPRTSLGRPVKRVGSLSKYVAIELIGDDRPGFLADCASILTENQCSVMAASLWTHNGRVASIIYVDQQDLKTCPGEETERLEKVKEELLNVLDTSENKQEMQKLPARVSFPSKVVHPERRLHQMLLSEQTQGMLDERGSTTVCVRNCDDTGYSVVDVKCRDRPKLLFDALCTLTDMNYVVHHATVETSEGVAEQEFYIKDMAGRLLTDAEQQMEVTKSLSAAIERRTPEGVCLVLRMNDRLGLLSEVANKFRELGLTVTNADVETCDGKAVNIFHVMNASGGLPDMKVLQQMRNEIGDALEIKESQSTQILAHPNALQKASSFLYMVRRNSEKFLRLLGVLQP